MEAAGREGRATGRTSSSEDGAIVELLRGAIAVDRIREALGN